MVFNAPLKLYTFWQALLTRTQVNFSRPKYSHFLSISPLILQLLTKENFKTNCKADQMATPSLPLLHVEILKIILKHRLRLKSLINLNCSWQLQHFLYTSIRRDSLTCHTSTMLKRYRISDAPKQLAKQGRHDHSTQPTDTSVLTVSAEIHNSLTSKNGFKIKLFLWDICNANMHFSA